MPSKYTKADLLWEATRRNMSYIDEFKRVSLRFAPIMESAKENIIPKIESSSDPLEKLMLNLSKNRIPDTEIDSYKWGISMVFKNSFTGGLECHRWLDPTISIDELLNDIKENNIHLFMAHPYFHWFESIKTGENNFYYSDLQNEVYPSGAHPNESKSGNDKPPLIYDYRKDYDTYVCFHKALTEKNIIFWFNPLDEDANIIEALTSVKNKVLSKMKADINILKKKGGSSYLPREIDSYIGWLRKYDEARELYKKKTGKEKLVIKNGAETLPSNFVNVILDQDTMTYREFANQQRDYKRAYKRAVGLIQSTPNIIFSPSRTKAIKNEDEDDFKS